MPEHLEVSHTEINTDDHPDWRAAREFGIDMARLEANLRLTPHERVLQLGALQRLRLQIDGRRWRVVSTPLSGKPFSSLPAQRRRS